MKLYSSALMAEKTFLALVSYSSLCPRQISPLKSTEPEEDDLEANFRDKKYKINPTFNLDCNWANKIQKY